MTQLPIVLQSRIVFKGNDPNKLPQDIKRKLEYVKMRKKDTLVNKTENVFSLKPRDSES